MKDQCLILIQIYLFYSTVLLFMTFIVLVYSFLFCSLKHARPFLFKFKNFSTSELLQVHGLDHTVVIQFMRHQPPHGQWINYYSNAQKSRFQDLKIFSLIISYIPSNKNMMRQSRQNSWYVKENFWVYKYQNGCVGNDCSRL